MTVKLCDLEYSVARLSLEDAPERCHLIILTPDVEGQNGDIIPAKSTMIHGIENIKALYSFLDKELHKHLFNEASI